MIAQLGYLGFEVSDLAAWEAFATGVLGLAVAQTAAGGALSLRMDGHAAPLLRRARPGRRRRVHRLAGRRRGRVRRDPVAAARRRRGRGARVTGRARARRHVAGLARFRDPGGVPTEIFHGPEMAERSVPLGPGPIRLRRRRPRPRSCGGVGASDQDETRAFYCDVLGFRLSDRIVAEIHGYHADMLFLHTNRRHHSVAFGGAPGEEHPPLHARGGLDGRRRPRLRSRPPRGRPHHAHAGAPPQRSDVLVLRTHPLRLPVRGRLGRARRRRRHLEADSLRPHQRVGAPPAGIPRSPADRR